MHLAVSLRPYNDPEAAPDLVYLNKRSTKPKMSSKVKGHLVTAVAWDRPEHITADSTGPLLVGTALGLVFEAEMNDTSHEKGALSVFKGNAALEKKWDLVFDVRGGKSKK